MRKSGPFLSIKLWAYTVVGAEPDSEELEDGALSVSTDAGAVIETLVQAPCLVDRKCHPAKSSNSTKAATKTGRIRMTELF